MAQLARGRRQLCALPRAVCRGCGGSGQPLVSGEPQSSKTDRHTRRSLQSVPGPSETREPEPVGAQGKRGRRRGLGCRALSQLGAHTGLQHTALVLCRGVVQSYKPAEHLSGVCPMPCARWAGQGSRQPHFASGKLSLRDEATCSQCHREDAPEPGPRPGPQPSP